MTNWRTPQDAGRSGTGRKNDYLWCRPAGLAATDPKLVPYGAMTATFYTGVGCLLGPSALFFVVEVMF